MKKLLIFVFVVVSTNILSAQTPKNLKPINSSKIVTEGIARFDEQKYAEAERLFKMIPLGDTMYSTAQYELAYTYSMQEHYEEALEISQALLGSNDGRVARNMVYTLTANLYSSLDQLEKAIETYDQALKIYPYQYNLHFNKGVVYGKMKEYEKMEACAKMAIFCNPSHQTSHYQLGVAYLRQQYFVPGILALNYAVMLNPTSSIGLQSLQTLNELYAESFDAFNEDENVIMSDEKKEKNKKYQMLEQLLRSNFSTAKSFKLKTDIKHIIVRQNQLIFENIEHNPLSTDIEEQLYIPTFQMIMKDKKDFNTYCYLIFQGTNVDNNKVSEKAPKMEKQFSAMYDKIIVVLKKAIVKGLGKENKEGLSYTYYSNYSVEAFGKYSGEKKYDGLWTVINTDGSLERLVTFENGILNGKSTYFDEKGNIGLETNFKNNKEHGDKLFYFSEDSKLRVKCPFEDGLIVGTRYEYNRSEILIEQTEWKNDWYDGTFLSYYPQGNLKKEINYKEGKISGKYTGYYQDGKTIQHHINVVGGDSTLVHYYPDGKIQLKAALVGNGYVGDYSDYYSDGNIETKGQYDSQSQETGQWTGYYPNGNMSYVNSYENGKEHGDAIYYSLDGKQNMKVIWKNGLITEVIYYNPDDTERERKTPKNKQITLDFYFMDGNISYLHRRINMKNTGDYHGKYFNYAPDGTILEETNYKDNLMHGVFKTYYPTGKLKTYCEYKNGMANGMYLEYGENDSLLSEGYLKDDAPAYIWYKYHPNGVISELSLYDETEIIQSNSYYPNGQLSYEILYKNDMIAQINYYDHEGKLLNTNSFENGNGEHRIYYLNGNILAKTTMKAGDFFGTSVRYDFDGKEQPSHNYVEGLRHGQRKSDNDMMPSVITLEENYLFGKKYGVEKIYYHKTGAIAEENYINGVNEGAVNNYYEKGKLNNTLMFVNGVRHGISTYYAADGKTIRYQLKHNSGQIYAYAYMNKDGKMSEFLPMGKEKVNIVSYYPGGAKSGEITFEKYLRQEKEMIYYPNGKLFLEKNYVDDTYHGEMQAWSENGKLKYKEYYQQDQIQGKCEYYHDNGKLRLIIHNVDNLPHGTIELYDSAGKLTETQTWFCGYRVK